MKTAFVFPGQGAQYVGMAMDFVANNAEYEKILKTFDDDHGTELFSAMQEGPEELLKKTSLTQPAILFHSICALREFQKRFDIKPEFVAGHSLGEFSAQVASGVMELPIAMHIVHKRGEFMINAVGEIPFAMAAVIGLDPRSVTEVCAEASEAGLVQAVNYNTPIQTVISGTKEGVARAGEIAKERGARRVLPLIVGGPFHTPLIEKAAVWLRCEMSKFEFKDGKIPVVSNLDALPSLLGNINKEKLSKQIISAVRWVDSVNFMIDAGVQRFIEFGPQKVLSGMIKNIDKSVQIYSVDTISDLDDLEILFK